MRQTRRQKDRGFTLVELMIVVGIIGLIASLAIPNYLRFTAKTSRSEMLEIVSKLELHFKTTYDNAGTMAPSDLVAAHINDSAINPSGGVPVGQPDTWNPSALGWSDFQFPPQGGVRMRYSYTLGAADGSGNVSDVTIVVCGSLAGLGANTVSCSGSMMGNYLYRETFHSNGTIDPAPYEFPAF